MATGNISLKRERPNAARSSFPWASYINELVEWICHHCKGCGRKTPGTTDSSGTGRLKQPLSWSSFSVVPHGSWQVEMVNPPSPCRLCGRKRLSVHFRMSACGHGESWISDIPPHDAPVPPPYGYGQDDWKNEAVRTTNQLNHSCTYGWIVISGLSDLSSLV